MENSQKNAELVDAQVAAIGVTVETMRTLRNSVSMHGRVTCDEIDRAATLHAYCQALRDHRRKVLVVLKPAEVVRLTLDEITERLQLDVEEAVFFDDPSDVRSVIVAAMRDFASDFRTVAYDVAPSSIDPEIDLGSFRLDSGSCLERWSESVADALVEQGKLFEQQLGTFLSLLECEANSVIAEKFYQA
jgi:hypothetical protein